MLNQLAQMDMSIYFQSVVFLIFIAILLRLHWKIGSFFVVTSAIAKYIVLICVFIYIFLNWASDVNPSLRSSSLFIMTVINIFLLWHVIVTALELPYRRALKSCVDGICTRTDLEQAFATGKRFYKFRYFWSSLGSGIAPWRFLRGIAAERTRDDLHRIFVNLDPKASLFGADLFGHFLKHQLAADKAMDSAARAQRRSFIETLGSDAWLAERTGEFLNHLLASPEELLDNGLKETLKDSGKMA